MRNVCNPSKYTNNILAFNAWYLPAAIRSRYYFNRLEFLAVTRISLSHGRQMRLTFSLPDERLFTIDVPGDTLISALRTMICQETGISEKNMVLKNNNQTVHNEPGQTVTEAGLADNDLIAVVINHSASDLGLPLIDFSSIPAPSAAPRTEAPSQHANSLAESVRQHFLTGPPEQLVFLRQRNSELADAINDPASFQRIFDLQRTGMQARANELRQLEHSDPLDPRIQERIAELIKQQNIDREMEMAMEFYPETFGEVTMLYVDVELNGHPIKAFVDSGAQTTIMSINCAKRCNLERLIDKRWAGMAYGVGTQSIIGRVHQAELKIGGSIIPSSFVVLENQPMDLMIGLDMLKRHCCCIDLRRNVLVVGDRVTVPFLPESELPAFARHPELARRPSGSDAVFESLTDEQEVKVTILTSQNIPRTQAITLLKSCNWDTDAAYAKYLHTIP
uniref:Ubiquitin-like domain-containing protein n=1 Tax=Schistocephalus solidus TaxID=70667 RepID=A0A0X3PV08_SCHSO